jgi:hypothetical protein
MSSIHFPPGTISSKLSSRMSKKPPSPKDWMHQTYMQMIQDVSYATNHYYESTENGNSLLHGTNKVCPDQQQPETQYCYKKSATVDDDDRISNNSSPLPYTSRKGKERDDSESYSSEDEESEDCNTYTTASTDYNRKNNIFRFYREQQNLANPIDEESSVIKVATPYTSSYYSSNESNIDDDNSSNSNGSMVTQEIDINVNTSKKQQRKKKFKLLKHMMTKMKLAAEKPFWAIDSHF